MNANSGVVQDNGARVREHLGDGADMDSHRERRKSAAERQPTTVSRLLRLLRLLHARCCFPFGFGFATYCGDIPRTCSLTLKEGVPSRRSLGVLTNQLIRGDQNKTGTLAQSGTTRRDCKTAFELASRLEREKPDALASVRDPHVECGTSKYKYPALLGAHRRGPLSRGGAASAAYVTTLNFIHV